MHQCGKLYTLNIAVNSKTNENGIPIKKDYKYDFNSPNELNIQFTSNLIISNIISSYN